MPILVGFLAEVKLLWRRQAGQLGHKLQTGDDGHKPPSSDLWSIYHHPKG